MKKFILRPADPERDFKQIAAWFSILEDEPTSESSLVDYYEKHRERIIQKVAEDEQGQLVGFCWIIRVRLHPELAAIHLFVKPEERGQGIGRQLYDDLMQAIGKIQVKQLQARILDTCPEFHTFAEKRGFVERRHEFKMVLDLDTFEDQPYEEIINKLRDEGFLFTSMEALGDVEETRRKLYTLNSTTDMETLGSNGKPAWDSFDDFQKRVCQSDWYKPGGQIIAIDAKNGIWAAMCAITRLGWHDRHANILFTGVDERYRGRKLGQAVKVLAQRYARDVLKADMVYTDNNTQNLPILAINRKLGYRLLPGAFLMEKILE
jgi:RimJ/RimL family protein N-acetyltransferase